MAPNPLDTVWSLKSWMTAPDPETTDQSDFTWSTPLVTTIRSSLGVPWKVREMLQPLSRTAKYAITKGTIRGPARTRINSAAQMETRCQCPSTVPRIRQCCGRSACRAQLDTGHEMMDCRDGRVLIQRQDNGGLCHNFSPNTEGLSGGEAPIPVFTLNGSGDPNKPGPSMEPGGRPGVCAATVVKSKTVQRPLNTAAQAGLRAAITTHFAPTWDCK